MRPFLQMRKHATSAKCATAKPCKTSCRIPIPRRGWIAIPVMEKVSSTGIRRDIANRTALRRRMRFPRFAVGVMLERPAPPSRHSIPPANTGSWCWRKPEFVPLTVEPVMECIACEHRKGSKLSAGAATLRCRQAAQRLLPRLRPVFHAQTVMQRICLQRRNRSF